MLHSFCSDVNNKDIIKQVDKSEPHKQKTYWQILAKLFISQIKSVYIMILEQDVLCLWNTDAPVVSIYNLRNGYMSYLLVFTFRSLYNLLGAVLAIFISILKKYLTQDYRYCKLKKNFWKVLYIMLRTSVEIWWYFVAKICVKRNLSPGLLRWSSLQTNEGQRQTEFHLVGFKNKIIKCLRRWQYDPLIIERTLGLVLGPSTDLYRPFLKHCTRIYKAVGLYDGPCQNLLRGDKVMIFVPFDC